jgi:hypothetical protein
LISLEEEQVMDQQQAGEPELSLPGRINEGMTVYDSADQPIGTVQLVYYGGASPEAVERALKPREGGVNAAAAEATDWGAFGSDDVPPELRARMLRQGYVRIEGPGITGLKCYVMPEQIANVVADRVELHGTRDELTGT